MGQKLTYMVHKDKIWTSRGKIVKLKQFLKLHPQYRNVCPGILHQSRTPFGLSTTHSKLSFLSAICGPDSDALEINLT